MPPYHVHHHLSSSISLVMALQPSLNPLIIAGPKDAPHTLDIFREQLPRSPCSPKRLTSSCKSIMSVHTGFHCTSGVGLDEADTPHSAKISRTMDSLLKPLFDQGGKYSGKVKLIARLQVQPWHASSTLTHEAALAVCSAVCSSTSILIDRFPGCSSFS